MKTDAILTPLLNSPKLPAYIAQMQAYLQQEAEKRTVFYEVIEDTIKSHAVTGFHIEVIAIFERTENMKELQRLIRGEAISEPEGW